MGGVAFLAAAIQTTKVLVARIKFHQRLAEASRDARVSLLHEALSAIKVVKMNTLEAHFLEALGARRRSEMEHLKAKLLYGIAFKVLRYAGTFVGFFSFLVHTVVRRKTISAQQGFTALVLFGTLRSGLMIWCAIDTTSRTLTSTRSCS